MYLSVQFSPASSYFVSLLSPEFLISILFLILSVYSLSWRSGRCCFKGGRGITSV